MLVTCSSMYKNGGEVSRQGAFGVSWKQGGLDVVRRSLFHGLPILSVLERLLGKALSERIKGRPLQSS